MEKRKVNLEEILHKYFFSDQLGFYLEPMKEAMKEACRQVLELAAENALDWDDYHGTINEESITNTINQVI